MTEKAEPIKITLTNALPAFSLWKTMRTYACQFGFIAIGVAVGSNAMQWMGFLVTILLAIGALAISQKNNYNLTIAEARIRLDQLEANAK